MIDHRTRLKELLRELFQFDAADLDFGIYRIMNQRRAEIEAFIEHGLLDVVGRELGLIQASVLAQKRDELEKQRREVIHALGEAAFEPSGEITAAYRQIPLALRFIAKQEEVRRTFASAEVEAEIFNALYTFFGRYYDDGDFVTQRRYSRRAKYAVPYNGEEVLLHWANRDQYYVKTADVLTDYAFRISSHGGYRVAFKLAAADTEQNNVKGQKRYFFPAPERLAVFDADRRELTLFFVYRPLVEAEDAEFGKTNVQVKLIAAWRDALLAAAPDVTLRGLLARIPEGKEVCILEMHLARWTRKSTSDYFIHKDLKGFLEGELDFYLKNEVMNLDDVDSAQEAQVQDYLTRLKVIRRIARQIITFLAQIEDFQKRLFEKTKFILRSDWCVTLDRLPETLYAQVIENPRQWAQWEGLGMPVPPAAERSAAYLQAHPGLMVDTALYPVEFKDAVLAALSAREGGLAGQRDGLLIHGENYQALRLLQPAYEGKVKCIYIDPPYNTGGDGFIYKDDFRHSTWLAMMEDRLRLARNTLSEDGVIFISIDENEQVFLRGVLDNVFGSENYVTTVIWQKVFSPKNTAQYFSEDHEYILVAVKNKIEWRPTLLRRSENAEARYSNPDHDPRGDWASSDLTARNYYSEGQYEVVSPSGKVFKPALGTYWRVSKSRFDKLNAGGQIWWGTEGNNMPRFKRYLAEVKDGVVPQTLWLYKDVGHTQDAKKELLSMVNFERTEDVLNTVKPTGLICRALQIGTNSLNSDLVMDFFAGSGTTAHAVLKQNSIDGGGRKYILVEMGHHIDSIAFQRIARAIYCVDWKDGKPVENASGVSHVMEYLVLESYEDTLDNLDLDRAAAPQPGLFPPERDDYLLRYFLEHETRQARLNLSIFDRPFQAAIRVRRDGVEQRLPVDLVETANYLLGVTVTGQSAFTHQDRLYRLVQGRIGRRSVALLWRDTPGLDLVAEAAYLQAQIFPQNPKGSRKPSGFERLYINGDSHIPGAHPVQQVFVQAMLETPRGIEEV